MEQKRITNRGFSVAEVMIAMVVLGIAITITTSTILHVVGQSEDTNVSNHAYELTRQKLLSITTGSTVVSKVGSDTPARDGITYTRSWTVDDTVSPAEVTVTTTWTTTGGRDDEVRLTGYIRGEVCPNLDGANSAPDSLDIFNAEGDTVTGTSPSLNITIPEGGTSGENRFVATLIGHDPDSAEGDFALPSLAPGVQDNDLFRISQNELRTDTALGAETYTVAVTLTDCFEDTLKKDIAITFTEADMLIIDDGDVTISEHVDEGAGGVQNIIPQDTIIHTMSANKDNNLIDWSIISGNTGDAFGIHTEASHHGKIFVNTPSQINYDENVKEYSLQVQGEIGSLSDIATVTVTIGDIIQTPDTTFLTGDTVKAGAPQGTFVGSLQTQDPDIDADHSYEVFPVGGNDFFTADGNQLVVRPATGIPSDFSGIVTIDIKTTDRGETSIQPIGGYDIKVVANDGGDDGDDGDDGDGGGDPCAGVDDFVVYDGTNPVVYSGGWGGNTSRVVYDGRLWEGSGGNQFYNYNGLPGENPLWVEVNVCTP